jgi:hypothetical protein
MAAECSTLEGTICCWWRANCTRLVKGIEIEVFFVPPDDVKPFLLRIQNLHIVFALFQVLVKVILDSGSLQKLQEPPR